MKQTNLDATLIYDLWYLEVWTIFQLLNIFQAWQRDCWLTYARQLQDTGESSWLTYARQFQDTGESSWLTYARQFQDTGESS